MGDDRLVKLEEPCPLIFGRPAPIDAEDELADRLDIKSLTVAATFALILSTSRPAVWIALEDTYYFVLRQLSAVGDFVKYVDSLY